jgi:hypothetical protein
MVPPLHWLVSPAADQVTGRRFVAAHWDPARGAEENVAAASAAAAWPGIGAKSQWADKDLAPAAVA